jgi:secondary thiamine-phosphate synthase enzyme
MEALASGLLGLHARLTIVTSQPTEFVDITEPLNALIARAGIRVGFANIQTLHTTTGVIVNEAEPLLLADFADLFERLAPACGSYRHDDLEKRTVNLAPGERSNGHAHCRAVLLSPSATVNVVDDTLQLGRWQRVFLVELDGPRSRAISVTLLGEAA